MGTLKLLLTILLTLPPGILSIPVAGTDEKIEVHCITEYRQYCQGKPIGLTFNDGCRECKCEKNGKVFCRKGGCTSFAKSEDDVLDYCDSISQKNAERLEKKLEETPQSFPEHPSVTKINLDAAKPGDLTKSERAEAEANIQKHFEDFLAGMNQEIRSPSTDSNAILQGTSENSEINAESTLQKAKSFDLPRNRISGKKARKNHHLQSWKHIRIPSRNRFVEDLEWPGIHRPLRKSGYRRNPRPEYDRFETDNRPFPRRYGRSVRPKYPTLVGASSSYWSNPRGRFLEGYGRSTYSKPSWRDDYSVNQAYDYIERLSSPPSSEKRYEEIWKETQSFIGLDQVAIDLLKSTNPSSGIEIARNSTEFKFMISLVERTLSYLTDELQEVGEVSAYEKYEFYHSMPNKLSKLLNMTKEARALLGDSNDPQEVLKNQQLNGLFDAMEDIINSVSKMAKSLTKVQYEGEDRVEEDADDDFDADETEIEAEMLPPEKYTRDLGDFEDTWTSADEIAFLKRKLAECMRLCSQCS